MKKNCFNCVHSSKQTDCDSDGYNTFDFYVCVKRSDDEEHYPKLDDPAYLERAKKCCDLPKDNNQGTD